MRQGRPPATRRDMVDGTGSAAERRCGGGDDARSERTKQKRRGKVRKMVLRSDGARGYSARHSESLYRRLMACRHGAARTDHRGRRPGYPAIYPGGSDIFGQWPEEVPTSHRAVVADARGRPSVEPKRMQRRVGSRCSIAFFYCEGQSVKVTT
jgi:hypothetical protein